MTCRIVEVFLNANCEDSLFRSALDSLQVDRRDIERVFCGTESTTLSVLRQLNFHKRSLKRN